MPVNKNATTRYQVLDRCFSDFKHKYTFDDLLEKVNEVLYDIYGTEINTRQLREDIRYMRDREIWNAPIKAYPHIGRKCYYRYSDSSFSIFKNELSVEEVQNLRSTIEMLNKYRGLPANAWLEEVISNLEIRFGVKSNNENLISFGLNDQLQGLEHLSNLIDATISHTPLVIVYRTYKGEESEQIVHPYYMRQYNNRWFLFGLNAGKGNISNFALDRIKSVRKADVAFITNSDVDFSTYFNDIIGVSVPRKEEGVQIEDIVLRFSPKRIPYVLSKPMHLSQEQLNDTDIKLRVYPTRELMQQIFSFGSDVEVVAPGWYRKEIMEKYEEIFKKYFPVQKDCIKEV